MYIQEVQFVKVRDIIILLQKQEKGLKRGTANIDLATTL